MRNKNVAALLDMNKRWLQQALELLGRIDEVSYATSPNGLAPHRCSGHLRHIVEFYECFLDGLVSTHIDYDARKRDSSFETSTTLAVDRVNSIIARLDNESGLFYDGVLFVRIEDADALNIAEPYVVSSVARELMTLSSHTIHHFALIAITLRAHDVEIDADFGVAPSTLRHREHSKSLTMSRAA